MDVHASGSRSLPRAATLFYLLMMPASRLVCQRPSSNFPYFRTPLANFLLCRLNSIEYGNSKTTTLLLSAKYTRPLFQGRTGCGGSPSGWYDIVTRQHLVSNILTTFVQNLVLKLNNLLIFARQHIIDGMSIVQCISDKRIGDHILTLLSFNALLARGYEASYKL